MVIPFFITSFDHEPFDRIFSAKPAAHQGKRHRAQMAAALRTRPQSEPESRQARRARQRRKNKGRGNV